MQCDNVCDVTIDIWCVSVCYSAFRIGCPNQQFLIGYCLSSDIIRGGNFAAKQQDPLH